MKLGQVVFNKSVRILQETRVSVPKTSQLMKCWEITVVYCEYYTKYTIKLCGQNAGFLSVKAGGTYGNQFALQC
jgi:hypothetical protein